MARYRVPISIVMPCFNVEKYVAEAIKSILNQTFNDFELIVVDDGSTDGTTNAILEICDDRIKLVRHEQNYGNYPARNTGILVASGKYIAMMDSDDIALPGRLLAQYDYLEKKKRIGAIGSHYNAIDHGGGYLYTCKGPSTYMDFKIWLLQNNCMLQSSIMIRRHLIVKHGLLYNTRYIYSSDYDFVRRCACWFPIYNIPQTLVNYRVHKEQISNNKKKDQYIFGQQVREQQFAKMGVKKGSQGMQLINKMMSHQNLTKIEIEECCVVLNEVLQFNKKYKFYSPSKLYDFFQSMVAYYLAR
ncbi:glycosyltransferase family 2 protein [Parapedobacter sp.]